MPLWRVSAWWPTSMDWMITDMREIHILEFVFDQVSTTIVNHEPINSMIQAEVEALSGWDHCDFRLAAHTDCDPNEPCCDMAEWPDERTVGEAVHEQLTAWLDESITDETVRLMIGGVLDLYSSQMLRLLGDLYTPDDAKVLRHKVESNGWQR